MCVVIDTNTFSCVFNEKDQRHSEFKPVRTWIIDGNGKLIYGGTKYKEELRKATQYLGLFSQLKKSSKAKEVDSEKVDTEQETVKRLSNNKKFNDSHLVAIIVVSRCNLVCSHDTSSYQFLTEKKFYPHHIKRPKIYVGLQSRNLLSAHKNCKPCGQKIKMKMPNSPEKENIQKYLKSHL